MKPAPRKDPEFLRYYASVLMREAELRDGDGKCGFSEFLRECTKRALLEAAAKEAEPPDQPDFFQR